MSESLMTWQLGNANGKYMERERIIALLEAEKWTDGTDPQYSIDEVIALITGENNASE